MKELDFGMIGPEEKKEATLVSTILKNLYFPVLFIYLEVVFHFYMKMSIQYTGMVIPFALSMGFVFSLLVNWFSPLVNRILVTILTFFLCMLFCIEIICKVVLQQYYQIFSVVNTATQNRLTDYTQSILTGIVNNILGLFLMLLPVALIILFGKPLFEGFSSISHKILAGIFLLFFAIMSHLIGILSMNLPWVGDFTPAMLYAADTNVDDQVEQLGMITMLRLDVVHTMFGVKKDLDLNFVSVPQYEIQDDVVIENTETEQAQSTEIAIEQVTEPVEQDIPEVPVVDTSPNSMNIDFDSLIASSVNEDQIWLNKYFKSVTPTHKNQYTGMFQGYNVIFITAEGFSKYLIDEKRTPTLYKMAHEGFVFNHFYTPLHYTSTSGGEFQNMVGLYPKNGNPISMKETGVQKTNLYFSLGRQLTKLGYYSIGFHNNGNMYGRNLSHSNLGYRWIQGNEGFEMEKNSYGNNVWPQSDLYLMEQTMDQYLGQDHFNVYYVTVSGHMPYNFTGDAMAVRNKAIVADLPYSEETKAYIAANYELEKAMTYLVKRLEEAGKAENTVIIISPDHIPYFDVDILEELSGKSFGGEGIEFLQEADIDYDIYSNSLIIWSESMEEPVQVDKICGQVDILPTISNLLGLEYDSRLLSGNDILSTSAPLVIFSSNSWLTDVGLYNRYTGKFTLAQGVSMSPEQIEEYVNIMKKVVKNKINASVLVIEQDYYNTVFPNSTESQEESK